MSEELAVRPFPKGVVEIVKDLAEHGPSLYGDIAERTGLAGDFIVRKLRNNGPMNFTSDYRIFSYIPDTKKWYLNANGERRHARILDAQRLQQPQADEGRVPSTSH